MLDAEVRLERLEIDNLHHFVLRGVEVQRVRWESRLGRISIDRVDVEAPVREALNGRYERLTVDGVDVRLLPSTRPANPPPQSDLQAREIEIHRGRLVAASGSRRNRARLRGELDGLGHRAHRPTIRHGGAFRSDAPARGLPWTCPRTRRTAAGVVCLGYAQPPKCFAWMLTCKDGPEPLRVEAEANRLRLQYGERMVELRQPRLEATGARDDPDNALRLTLRPTVFGIEAAALEAVLDDETYALRSGHAELRGIEIATLLESGTSLPDRWTVDGRADFRIRTDDGQSFAYELDTRLDSSRAPAGQRRPPERKASRRPFRAPGRQRRSP